MYEQRLIGKIQREGVIKGTIVSAPRTDYPEHNVLLKRDDTDCHPITSITGLTATLNQFDDELDTKQDLMTPLSTLDIFDICN